MRTLLEIFLAALCAAAVTGCMTLIPMIAPGVDAEASISAEFPYASRYVEVLGSRMHYVEEGQGDPILLIHGNPTSSYLWRNVIPHVEPAGRVIALDLIGMGKSDKPEISYQLQDHIRYVEGFIEALALENIVLVLHDWGGGIGFDYAMRHPQNVRGIVFMEAVVRPARWENTSFAGRTLFKALRDEERGHELIVEENYFVEKLIPMMSGRDLSEVEMTAYRAPFLEPEHRKPVRVWPQEIPFDGIPARNQALIAGNYEALRESTIPLLLLVAEPGVIMNERAVATIRSELPRLETEPIGPGLHYVQESQPTNIGRSTAHWIDKLEPIAR
jgi:haloalkane dehalogenase